MENEGKNIFSWAGAMGHDSHSEASTVGRLWWLPRCSFDHVEAQSSSFSAPQPRALAGSAPPAENGLQLLWLI